MNLRAYEILNVTAWNLLSSKPFERIEEGNNITIKLDEDFADLNEPIEVDARYVEHVRLTESAFSDLIGILCDGFTDFIIDVSHANFDIPELTVTKKHRQYNAIQKWKKKLMMRMLKNGIRINGYVYRYVAASAADLKAGTAKFLREDLKRLYGRKLLLLRDKAKLQKWSACEQAKVIATMMSGSAELENAPTVDETVIVPDVEYELHFGKAMVMDKHGNIEIKNGYKQKVVVADGQGLIICENDEELKKLAALQGRLGPNCKEFLVGVKRAWIFERAEHFNVKCPTYIKDIWGKRHKLSKVRIILSESCAKAIGWFESLEDWRTTANEMGCGKLRCCRMANETAIEEGKTAKRGLSRQGLQELIFATGEQLNELAKAGAEKLRRLNSVEGQLKELTEDKGTYAHFAFRAYPDLLAQPQVYESRKEHWENMYAETSYKPTVSECHYEYVAIDPIAMIDTMLLHIDPAKEKVGLLNKDECHVTWAENGTEIACVRFPANLMNMRVLKNVRGFNHVQHYYAHLDGVLVLSFYDVNLIGYWDGDNDGDELWCSANATIVDLVETMVEKVNPLPLVFPHDKANKHEYPKDAEEYFKETASLLWYGYEYNLVGLYSNLATKILSTMRPASFRSQIMMASLAHVMTILILDFIKTGMLPDEIMEKANKLLSDFKKMPFEQRFVKHNSERKYYDETWQEETKESDGSVCCRYANAVKREVDSDAGRFAMFKVDVSDMNYNFSAMLKGGFPVVKSAVAPNSAVAIAEYSGHPYTRKVIGTSDLFKACFNKYTLLENNKDREQVRVNKGEALQEFRATFVEFARLDANFANMDEREVLRACAEQIWRWIHSETRKTFNNEGRTVFFALELFGDLYAENVHAKRLKFIDETDCRLTNLPETGTKEFQDYINGICAGNN